MAITGIFGLLAVLRLTSGDSFFIPSSTAPANLAILAATIHYGITATAKIARCVAAAISPQWF
jgi:hypothetical protein